MPGTFGEPEIVDIFSQISSGVVLSQVPERIADALWGYVAGVDTYTYSGQKQEEEILRRLASCLTAKFCLSRYQATQIATVRAPNCDWPTLVGARVTVAICMGLADRCRHVRVLTAANLEECPLPRPYLHPHYEILVMARQLAPQHLEAYHAGNQSEWRRFRLEAAEQLTPLATQVDVVHGHRSYLECQHQDGARDE
jgi:hypothetical protein